jgi:hypothetical protein
LPRDVVVNLPKRTTALASTSVCREPLPISSIVLPTFDPDAAGELRACVPADIAVELLRGCPSLALAPHRALAGVSRLVQQAAGFRLRYRHGSEAARLVDEALAGSPGRLDVVSAGLAR